MALVLAASESKSGPKPQMQNGTPCEQETERSSEQKKSENESKITIVSINIVGTKRIDKESITDHFIRNKDNQYTSAELDSFIKDLFSTGLFSDISFSVSGTTLTVNVIENKCINQIAFEGNSKANDEDIRNASSLKPREVCTNAKIQESVNNIKALYRAKGNFNAIIKPKLIERQDGRVDIVFEINEKATTYVREIYFSGNSSFGDGTLSSVVSTKETAWYKFLSSDDVYDPNRIKYDAELLRQFYLKNGYADVHIVSANAEISPEYGDFFVTFVIDEGKRYTFEKSSIKSEISNIKVNEEMQDLISFEKGDWFDSKEIQNVTDAITEYLTSCGYPFIEVIPVPQKDPKNLTVGITFVIRKIMPSYARRIDVNGNFGTDANVVLREMCIYEGGAITPWKMAESEKKLYETGYFESVEIKSRATSARTQKNLIVNVKEQSTGAMNFGAGYSTSDGPIGKIGYGDSNLLGQGIQFSCASSFSKRSMDFDTSFANPYLFGRNLSGGVDLFHTVYRGDTRGNFKDGGYHQMLTGIGFRIGYDIRKDLTQILGYGIHRDKLSLREKDGSSPFLRPKRPLNYISSVTNTLLFNRVKRLANDPVGGYFIRMDNEYAGLGGTIKYFKNTLEGAKFVSLDEDMRWILKFEARCGIFNKIKNSRFADQFIMGGLTMGRGGYGFPGFNDTGVGAKDAKTLDSLGGKKFYTAATKLYFPIGLPRSIPINGVAFVQIGSLWDCGFCGTYKKQVKERDRKVIKELNRVMNDKFFTRVSLGGGMIWKSPLGNLGAIWTKLARRSKGDSRRCFFVIWGHDF